MDIICFILLILLSLGSFWVGYWYISRWPGKWRRSLTWLAITSLGGFALLHFNPHWEYHNIPLWLTPFVEIISFIPLVTFYFGVSAGEVRFQPPPKPRGKGFFSTSFDPRFLQISLIFLAALIFGYGLARVNWIYLDNGVDPARARVDKNRFCLQSTGYTCGAASAVNLLKYWNIGVTEKEMAHLSRTRYGLGVAMVPLTRAVAQKARTKGLETDIIKADWNTLTELNVPCLVDVKWGPLIDHVIVILKTEKNTVVVIDPLGGQERWTKKQFLDIWHGSAIVINQNNNLTTDLAD